MLHDIRNFLQLTDTLLTGGMPTADQLGHAARAGVKLVINLAPFDPESDLRDEPSIVKSAGMEYLNIPVDWESPRRSDLDEFMNAMEANLDRKVLVHCRANYRASGFVALYRVLRLRWQVDAAMQDLHRIWDPDEYPVWKTFIEENLPSR